jgi:integrase/recombinase XerC
MPAKAALHALLQLDHGPANGVALSYVGWMGEQKYKSSYISRLLSALRSAVTTARILGLVNWSIEVQGPKVVPYRDTRGPGPDGWIKIRQTVRARAILGDPQAIRDYAIVQLLRNPALRASEVVGLDLADLELEGSAPSVWVLGKGRTDKERLPLAASVVESIRAWLVIRGEWVGPLFVRLDKAADVAGDIEGRPRLTARSIGNIAPALGHRAGLRKRTNPHAFRHEGISAVVKATNGNLPVAQKFSRHGDVRTLLLYDDARRDEARGLADLIDGE